MNDEIQIEMSVTMFNLTYLVRGFPAIAELKQWLDTNAECITHQFEPQPTLGAVSAEPTPAPVAGNGTG